MSQQHIDAQHLLAILRDRIKSGQGPIQGYHTAANLIGRNGNTDARYMGQVCSRLDYACWIAGLPMLSFHMVRKADGSLNGESFSGSYASWRPEVERIAVGYPWTDDELDKVLGCLRAMPGDSAKLLWDAVIQREYKQPGYFAYSLHRHIQDKRIAA